MDVLVISIANPILIGLYKNNKLIKVYEKEGQSSDIIPLIFEEILKEQTPKRIFYVNAPGSYMAIKVAYVFLKTLAITKKLELLATNGFHFNQNSPIKALGKKYFMLENGEIIVDFIEQDRVLEPFCLPPILDETIFSNENLPEYNLPAV